LQRAGGALAVDVKALARQGPTVLTAPGGPVLAVPTAEGGRFYDAASAAPGRVTVAAVDAAGATLAGGPRLAPLPTGRAMWFSWYAEQPLTDHWPRRRPRPGGAADGRGLG
jgi:hypothetical protein